MKYDQHPTDPAHGGKMTVEQMADYIDQLQQEADELKCGLVVLVPSSIAHAEAMILVATSYIDGVNDTRRSAKGVVQS